MKPYNDFEIVYKENISVLFTKTDSDLKSKTDEVESRLLNQKVDFIREYFADVNTFDFLKFEDINLKIIRSKSDKAIKVEIDEILTKVKQDLKTIETLQNKDRILAKYQICKDFNRAISEVNIEIEREKLLAEQKAKREADETERRLRNEQQQAEITQQAEAEQKVINQEPEQVQKVEPTLVKTSFEVIGTIEQIRSLKEFMRNNNIQFGGIR